MSIRSVYCLAPSRARADRIVSELKVAEFPGTEISVLFLERGPGETLPAKPKVKAKSKARAKRAAPPKPAAKPRGALGWVDGVGRLVVPEVDPLLGGGPIAAALRDVKPRTLAGGLIDYGLPAVEARRFEEKIKAGHFLVSAHSSNPEKSDQARALFNAAEAESVFTMMEVKTPKVARFSNHGIARSRGF